jgi:heme-degrading monooxygenase HmoA
MTTMIVQHKVKDFSAWKKVYDSMKEVRASNGELSDKIYHEESDPNKLCIVFEWDSQERAQKWSRSPELKGAMEKAGVEGPPSVYFLNGA